jgi:hypothetical protein
VNRKESIMTRKADIAALLAKAEQQLGSIMKEYDSGGGSVAWTPNSVRFGSGVFIGGVPVNPSTQMPVADPRPSVTKTIWVDFEFDGIGGSAIQLLRESLGGVKAISVAFASSL